MNDLDAHKELEQLLREASAGFSVPPPDAAWQHIEQAIRPEKKRRRLIWLLLPLLLGAGIYWISGMNDRPSPAGSPEARATKSLANTGFDKPATTGTPAQDQAVAPTQAPLARGVPPEVLQTPDNTPDAVQKPVTLLPQQDINAHKTGYTPRQAINRPTANRRKPITQISTAVGNRDSRREAGIPATTTETAAPVADPVQDIPVSSVAESGGTETQPAPIAKTITDTVAQSPKTITVAPNPSAAPALAATASKKWTIWANGLAGAGLHTLTYGNSAKNYAANFGNSYSGSDRVVVTNLPHRVGFTGGLGLGVQYQLRKRLALETGLSYFTTGYQIDAYAVTPVEINLAQSGFSSNTVSTHLNSSYASVLQRADWLTLSGGNGPVRTTLVNRYHFLSVPLTLVYQPVSKNRLSFVMRTGLAAELRLNRKRHNLILSPEQGRYFTDPSLEKTWNLAAMLEPGLNLKLRNQRHLQLGLFGKIATGSTYTSAVPLKEYLLSTGLSLRYSLWQSRK